MLKQGLLQCMVFEATIQGTINGMRKYPPHAHTESCFILVRVGDDWCLSLEEWIKSLVYNCIRDAVDQIEKHWAFKTR